MLFSGDFSFPIGGASTSRIRNFAQALNALGGVSMVLPLGNRVEEWSGWKALLFHADGTPAAPSSFSPRAWPASRDVGAKLLWVIASYTNSWRIVAGFWREAVRRDGEVLFVYGRSCLRLLPLIMAARSKGMKIALDVVEGIERFHGVGGKINPVYWDWWLGSRLLPRMVDRTYAISSGLAERCRQLGAKEVRLLPAIETWPAIPPSRKPAAAVFRLVYLGGLSAKEAPEMLLALAESLAQLEGKVLLAIAGRYMDNPEGREWSRRISKVASASGVVSLHGSLSDADLASFKEEADGFLLLRADTVAERLAFPTRVVEFLKTGRPLWISDVGDVRRYLQDEKSGFLLSTDPRRAPTQLRRMLDDVETCQRVGIAGFLAGRENFDRAVHVRSLLEWETMGEVEPATPAM